MSTREPMVLELNSDDGLRLVTVIGGSAWVMVRGRWQHVSILPGVAGRVLTARAARALLEQYPLPQEGACNTWHPTDDDAMDARKDEHDARLEFAGVTEEEINQGGSP